MPNPRAQDRALDALYATLPQLECQGYCHDSCGPIDMSLRERARIVARARKPVKCGAGASCSMLTEDRRCGVYDIRPTICRLWGMTRKMPCPYGCEPERWLTDAECVELIVQAERIGGDPGGDRRSRAMENVLAALSEEELARMAAWAFRHGRATIGGRDSALDRAGARPPFANPQTGVSHG